MILSCLDRIFKDHETVLIAPIDSQEHFVQCQFAQSFLWSPTYYRVKQSEGKNIEI